MFRKQKNVFIKKQKQSKLTLLDLVGFRISLAVVIASLLIILVSVVEQSQKKEVICSQLNWQCLSQQVLYIIGLSNIEGFSILTAATLYILESWERKQRLIYEAWQVIDNAQVSFSTSYARIQALEDLNKYKVSLENIKFPGGADLSNINLAYANLINTRLSQTNLNNANLSNANLSKANLKDANLYGADLSGATLSRVDLRGTDLRNTNLNNTNLAGALYNQETKFSQDYPLANKQMYLIASNSNLKNADLSNADLNSTKLQNSVLDQANLKDADISFSQLASSSLINANLCGAKLIQANLQDTNFTNAILHHADFRNANLDNADFSYADFQNALFEKASITGTCFCKATNLEPEKIKTAIGWEKAIYDDEFRKKL
ncbi:hypothetical protein CAL7716_101620 (plasmid) [Calothrix sp. PCC 7716]|nr:hypothetical protein CAL7716_101620 [Calothrix sp. PCC 7716]